MTLDRPRPELPIRRCESIDEAMNLVMNQDPGLVVSFPQNIKTVTAATIMKGPEDYTAGLQVVYSVDCVLELMDVLFPPINNCTCRKPSICELTTLATLSRVSPGSREAGGSAMSTGSKSAHIQERAHSSSGTSGQMTLANMRSRSRTRLGRTSALPVCVWRVRPSRLGGDPTLQLLTGIQP